MQVYNKLHSEDANRAGALEQNAYAKEVAFYEKYANEPDFPVPVPKVHIKFSTSC